MLPTILLKLSLIKLIYLTKRFITNLTYMASHIIDRNIDLF